MQSHSYSLSRGILSAILWFDVWLLAGLASAADPLEEIAPFLEPLTIAVARVDLGDVDFERSVDTLFRRGETADGQAEEAMKLARQADEFRRKLIATGAERMWITLSFPDLTLGPALLFPTEAPDATAEFLRELPPQARQAMGPNPQVRVIEGVVVVGPPALIGRLSARPAASRPELAQLVQRLDGFPIALAVVPTDDMQRVMREMLPDLPPEWGGASGETLAGAVAQLSVGLDLSSPARAMVHLEGDSEENARAALPAIRQVVERSELPIAPDEIRQEGSSITYRMEDATVRAVAQALAGPLKRSRDQARRMQSSNNLKQLGLAMHNYHDVHRHLPPSGKASDDSRGGLSWRVHLLPFLEEAKLYEQFKLDEPWDSPHNRQLIEQMPEAYRSPLAPELPPGQTVYQLPRMEGSVYGIADSDEPPRFKDITDGLSNTVFVFESHPDAAVPWTQPEDLQIDPENPWEKLRVEGRDYVPMLIVDGSVRMLPADVEPETLRGLITRAGGERAAPR